MLPGAFVRSVRVGGSAPHLLVPSLAGPLARVSVPLPSMLLPALTVSCGGPLAQGTAGLFNVIASVIGSQTDSWPKTYSESRTIGYTPAQVFSVVIDVNQYKNFVPWCTHSVVTSTKVLSDSDAGAAGLGGRTLIGADLVVGFPPFCERYSSVISAKAPSVISVRAGSSSIFKQLHTQWTFTPVGSHSCKVRFDISFDFHSRLHKAASGLYFSEVATKMVQSFENRCASLYGPSRAHSAASHPLNSSQSSTLTSASSPQPNVSHSHHHHHHQQQQEDLKGPTQQQQQQQQQKQQRQQPAKTELLTHSHSLKDGQSQHVSQPRHERDHQASNQDHQSHLQQGQSSRSHTAPALSPRLGVASIAAPHSVDPAARLLQT